MKLTPLHERLLADILDLGSLYPLVLTGGCAVQAHGLVERFSRDLDVATENPAPMDEIVAALTAGLAARGWRTTHVQTDPLSGRFLVTDPDTGEECEVDVLKEAFWAPPAQAPYGPVLSLDRDRRQGPRARRPRDRPRPHRRPGRLPPPLNRRPRIPRPPPRPVRHCATAGLQRRTELGWSQAELARCARSPSPSSPAWRTVSRCPPPAPCCALPRPWDSSSAPPSEMRPEAGAGARHQSSSSGRKVCSSVCPSARVLNQGFTLALPGSLPVRSGGSLGSVRRILRGSP